MSPYRITSLNVMFLFLSKTEVMANFFPITTLLEANSVEYKHYFTRILLEHQPVYQRANREICLKIVSFAIYYLFRWMKYYPVCVSMEDYQRFVRVAVFWSMIIFNR